MLASEIRKLTRDALTGKWGKAALVTLVYFLIVCGISLVLNHISVIGPIAQYVIDIPIAFGLISTFMKLKRGEEVSYIGFLTDGFSNFANSWKVTLWTAVKMIIPIIILIVSYILIIAFGIGGLILSSATSDISSSASAATAIGAGSMIFIIIGFIGIFISSIWLTIKSYSYQLIYFLLFDNPNKDAKEIVEESEQLMNGNRWRLFCLELSFIGWIFLACFTFGIGMLWLMPYMSIAQIVFYEVLVGKNADKVETTVSESTVTEPVVEEVPTEAITEEQQEGSTQEDTGPISE